HAGRFRIWIPRTGKGASIYVHAKLTIVDDEILRVGSANMNNSSMGLDSECDVFIDTARPRNAHAGEEIARLRLSLLAEHCGVEVAHIRVGHVRRGSRLAMLDTMTRERKHLLLFDLQKLSDTEKAHAENSLLDP